MERSPHSKFGCTCSTRIPEWKEADVSFVNGTWPRGYIKCAFQSTFKFCHTEWWVIRLCGSSCEAKMVAFFMGFKL
jgi:hypothetical protein